MHSYTINEQKRQNGIADYYNKKHSRVIEGQRLSQESSCFDNWLTANKIERSKVNHVRTHRSETSGRLHIIFMFNNGDCLVFDKQDIPASADVIFSIGRVNK